MPAGDGEIDSKRVTGEGGGGRAVLFSPNWSLRAKASQEKEKWTCENTSAGQWWQLMPLPPATRVTLGESFDFLDLCPHLQVKMMTRFVYFPVSLKDMALSHATPPWVFTHTPNDSASLRTASVLCSMARTTMRHRLSELYSYHVLPYIPLQSSSDWPPPKSSQAVLLLVNKQFLMAIPIEEVALSQGSGHLPRGASSAHPHQWGWISSYKKVSMCQCDQCSRNPHGAVVWDITRRLWIYKLSSVTGEKWQGSQSITIWLTVVSVLPRLFWAQAPLKFLLLQLSKWPCHGSLPTAAFCQTSA